MKRFTSILLLAALAFSFTAWSCEQDPEPEQNNEEQQKPEENNNGQNGNTETPTGPQPGTYKFVASPLKGTWKAGDQIYVHGNLGTSAEIVTLAAGDISADGKTATGNLSSVTEAPFDPDGLYAAWPAESVYLYKGVLKIKTTFEKCEDLLTQAYLKDDTFTFTDVSSMISFSVDGDYDNWAICSTDREGICITRFESEYSSQTTKFNYKQNDGYPFRYGSIVSGKAQIYFPGDFPFAKGFTIYLAKGDSWTASFTSIYGRTLKVGENLDLGNITTYLEAYNGLPPRMPRQGEQTKYTVQFNELSGVRISEDGTFIWGLGDDGELGRLTLTGEVISQYHCGGDAEDVSINTDTHDLLLGMEPDGVGIIKAPDFNTRYSTLMSLEACAGYGNSGIEGLTYYKEGMVFAGAQSNSHLFLCDINAKKVLWETKLYDKSRVSEIAGLSYDPLTGWLWIIDSENKKVFVYDIDHSVDGEGKYSVRMDYLGAYPVAGSNPESVCVDQINKCIWVGDDYGETSYLYRYEFPDLANFDK